VVLLVRIKEIEAGSIAEELHLEIGTRIVRINGQRVRDGIDLTFLLADTSLELETLGPDGEQAHYDILREPGDSIGIIPPRTSSGNAATSVSFASSTGIRKMCERLSGCGTTTFVSRSRTGAT